jgi:hypothetical protein
MSNTQDHLIQEAHMSYNETGNTTSNFTGYIIIGNHIYSSPMRVEVQIQGRGTRSGRAIHISRNASDRGSARDPRGVGCRTIRHNTSAPLYSFLSTM